MTRPSPFNVLPVPLPRGRDAWNRALRTFVGGLLVDVAYSACGVLAVALADVRLTRAYWVGLGLLLAKTVGSSAVAYAMRHLKPPPSA